MTTHTTGAHHTQRLITRQAIAEMLLVSSDCIRKNEQKLGLKMCRVDVTKRVVRYRLDDVLKALRSIGVS